jgi:SAM-dependent methyltransferase
LKRNAQAWLFEAAGIQGLLDEREKQALERHMGFPGQWDEHRRFQIEELHKLGLRSSSALLEIGCGPLTAGIPIIEYLDSGKYIGVDVRPDVLDRSWQQVGKNGLSIKNPRLIQSDSFGADQLEDRKFDFIWAFSVLFHLSDDLLDKLFAIASKHLAPGGQLVANVQIDMDNSTWFEFPFLRRTTETYASVAAGHGLKMTNLGTIEERGFRLAHSERTNPLLTFDLS